MGAMDDTGRLTREDQGDPCWQYDMMNCSEKCHKTKAKIAWQIIENTDEYMPIDFYYMLNHLAVFSAYSSENHAYCNLYFHF